MLQNSWGIVVHLTGHEKSLHKINTYLFSSTCSEKLGNCSTVVSSCSSSCFLAPTLVRENSRVAQEGEGLLVVTSTWQSQFVNLAHKGPMSFGTHLLFSAYLCVNWRSKDERRRYKRDLRPYYSATAQPPSASPAVPACHQLVRRAFGSGHRDEIVFTSDDFASRHGSLFYFDLVCNIATT